VSVLVDLISILTSIMWTTESLKSHLASPNSTGSRELKGHKGAVNGVAWSSDGRRLASASSDHTIRVWSLKSILSSQSSSGSGASYQEMKGHTGSVEQVAWSPADVDVLASLGADKTVKIWDTRSSTCTTTLSFPSFSPLNMAWCPAGIRMAIGGKDDTAIIVDVRTNAVSAQRKFPCEVNQMAWSPDATLLCLTTGSGAIQIYSPDNLEQQIHQLTCHTANAFCISWPRHGSIFAVGAADALVSIWNAGEMVCTRTVGRLDWPIRALGFSHCGTLLAASSTSPAASDQPAGFIDVSQVETGLQVGRIGVTATVGTMAWHPSRWILAYAGEEMDGRSARPQGNLRLFIA